MKKEYQVLAYRVINRDGSEFRSAIVAPRIVFGLDGINVFREELKIEHENARIIYLEYESKE